MNALKICKLLRLIKRNATEKFQEKWTPDCVWKPRCPINLDPVVKLIKDQWAYNYSYHSKTHNTGFILS